LNAFNRKISETNYIFLKNQDTAVNGSSVAPTQEVPCNVPEDLPNACHVGIFDGMKLNSANIASQ
jgi:hypothetical protein